MWTHKLTGFWAALREKCRSSTMRRRLILAFALFAAAAIGSLWILQTFFMDDLYERVKYREISRSAGRLETVLGTEQMENTALSLTEEYELCLSVYQIRQGTGSLVMELHSQPFCLLPMITSPSQLQTLYQSARQAPDGIWQEEISVDTLLGDRYPAVGITDPDDRISEVDRTRSILYVRLLQSDRGQFMLLLTTELQPLSTAITTMRLQMVMLTLLLAVLTVLFSAVLSARYTRPLTEMSAEAGKLSMGNYNVNFDGGGCVETEQLSAALNRAAYELSRLDKMQKDLIANISHDLRTPLTMISGYSEVIRDLPGEATPENMQVIIDEVARLTSLVNDMLEVSRYQNGTQILHAAPFNLTACLRQTLERYARLREREGYRLLLEAAEDVWVQADETRILQVLYNLINNAVNYTGEDKTVTIRQTVRDGEVLLAVIDTGVGIPQDQLPLVWERYYKVHDFHKRANMGTGLGLSIVKNILVLHGARFGVQSQPDQGSTFWFSLPVIPPPSSSVDPAKADLPDA